MDDIFSISQCNIAQIIAESNRFLFQVLLVHIVSSIIEGRDSLFNETLFRTLLVTAVAIALYHLFFRKIVEPKLEKMKIVCTEDPNERNQKLTEINTKDPTRPTYKKKIDLAFGNANDLDNAKNPTTTSS